MSDEGGRVNPRDEEHGVLFQSIRTGEPINSGHHMADATLVTVMGQLSCFSGKEVTWPQALKSDFFYPPMPDDCSVDMKPPVQLGKDGIYPFRVPGKSKLL